MAGPSEVLILASSGAKTDPHWLAADLLAQAEHDERAQAILITDDLDFAYKIEKAVHDLLARLPRAAIARAAWRDFGAIIVVNSLAEEGVPLANRIAAEHVELAMTDSDAATIWPRHPPCWGDIFRPLFPRSHWRLRCRAKPCAAHRRYGTFYLGPWRVVFHETHQFDWLFARRFGVIRKRCHFPRRCRHGPLADAEGLHAHAESVRVRLG